ncbi:BPSS1780 family membrane protein [Noviherbaspirillum agri]
MKKLPPITGWLWVKEGFALFRKQPAEISTLFIAYMFLMLVVGLVPLLGQILPIVLMPVFSVAFLQACMQLERGEKVYPNLLLVGFRSPEFPTLLKLGALYLVAAVIAVGASVLVDGGVFWQLMSGGKELDPETIRQSNMSLGMMFSALVYLPAGMAFWYAPYLIKWQKMNVSKAIFYSFFAVKHAGKAFVVYGLAWLLFGVLLPAILSSLLAMLFGTAIIMMVVLLPLTLMLTVVMYCSFYPTYTHVFGKPGQNAPEPERIEAP